MIVIAIAMIVCFKHRDYFVIFILLGKLPDENDKFVIIDISLLVTISKNFKTFLEILADHRFIIAYFYY